MPNFLAGLPFWGVFTFLFVLAIMRGQGTYWVARFVTNQTLTRTHPTVGWRLRVHQALEGQGTQHGIAAIRRWGLLAVPVAYVTVGIQSMVMLGAGVLRIPCPRFLLAQIPGALAWATIYSTIGFTVWYAAISAAAGSPAALIALTLLMAAVVTHVVVARRRRVRRAQAAGALAGTPGRMGAGLGAGLPADAAEGCPVVVSQADLIED